jgi:hypothetical protein
MLSSDPPSKNRVLYQIFILIAICMILGILAVYFNVFKAPDKQHNVTFRVESTSGFATISFKDANSSQTQGLNIPTPWERTWTNPKGAEVYLTAGNPSSMGTIRCILKIDGREWKRMEATIPESSVACAGIVP